MNNSDQMFSDLGVTVLLAGAITLWPPAWWRRSQSLWRPTTERWVRLINLSMFWTERSIVFRADPLSPEVHPDLWPLLKGGTFHTCDSDRSARNYLCFNLHISVFEPTTERSSWYQQQMQSPDSISCRGVLLTRYFSRSAAENKPKVIGACEHDTGELRQYWMAAEPRRHLALAKI